MDAIDRLIDAVAASGLKQVHIARVAGISATKLNKILRRKQVPTVPEFIAVARAIGLDPGRLFTDGDLVIDLRHLRAAHASSQQLLEEIASWLPEARSSHESIPSLMKPTPSHDVAPVRAAANPNAELIAEFETERKRIPRRAWNRGARIIARAVGDSMDGGRDPIRNGELAYLKRTSSGRAANNRITLVRRGDALFLKLFERSGHAIRLVSTNGETSIELDARSEDLRIYGYVVDHGPEE